jgi:transposase
MATRETWAARVREWKRSGLTAADYAEREGFNASTLTWWSSRLGPSALVPRTPPVLEVVMSTRPGQARSLEVVLESGVRVAVPIGFDEPTLRRLLSVLEGS